jgi:nitrate reductase gamma subunit
MESLLAFAKGPLFAVTVTFMILGLARHVYLQLGQVLRSVRRLSYRKINIRLNLKEIGRWLAPVGHIYHHRPFFSTTSFLFHLGILVVPLFLANHIAMLSASLGIGWPAIPAIVADVLTLVALAAGIVLLGIRIFDRDASALSTAIDYFLLAVVVVPFLSGFMAMHPSFNPLSYQVMLLIHVLSAELLFVLMPLTKLAHGVLFPFDRFSSEIFWKMPAGAGDRVARELHGEEARV